MKNFIGLILLIFVGVIGWRVGGSLSSDAVSMAVGVLFGIMAGIPTALLVLASDRRRQAQAEQQREAFGHERNPYGHYAHGANYPQQPPVIVLTGAPSGQPTGYGLSGQADPRGLPQTPAWPGEQQPGRMPRKFKVVGEKEEWVDEW